MTNTKNIPKGIGDLLLLITAIVWGGGFIGVSKSLDTLSPFYMIAIRFAIASVLMIILFWKKFKAIKKEDLLPGCMIGTFLFLGFTFQTVGALYISVGKLSFLTALNVIIVPFLTFVVFKQHIKKYNLIAGLIAVVGFGFLNLNQEAGFSVGGGELLGILCAVFFAAHITVLGQYADKMDAIVLAILQMITCCVLGFICALLFEEPPKAISMEMAIPVVYLGVFSSFCAFLCQTIGQKYTSASRAAIILCMESVFGTALSVLILKEALTLQMIIGATLILTAVITAEYMHVRSEKSETAKEQLIINNE